MVTKTVAITMGDPAGIGPEIIVKALSEDELNGAPLVVVGCLQTLKRLQANGLAEGVTFRAITQVADARFVPASFMSLMNRWHNRRRWNRVKYRHRRAIWLIAA